MAELSRVYASSDGVVNQVSVLVSVADAYATKPLLHTQLELEAEVGIEHHFLIRTDFHNSQQYKPLRSFLNVFNILRRVLWLQELFWKAVLLFANQPRTIATLLFYWSVYWRFMTRQIYGICRKHRRASTSQRRCQAPTKTVRSQVARLQYAVDLSICASSSKAAHREKIDWLLCECQARRLQVRIVKVARRDTAPITRGFVAA